MKNYIISLLFSSWHYIVAFVSLIGLGTVLTDKETFGPQSPYGNAQNPQVDPNTATIPAGVWTPNFPITQTDAGAAAMTGITVPYATFSGRITVIPGGAFTWTTATNIGLAGTAVVGKALDFVYIGKSGKWYPSYIA